MDRTSSSGSAEGWRVKRVRGSHHLMEKAGRAVPVHGAADIGKGLLAEIDRQTRVKSKV